MSIIETNIVVDINDPNVTPQIIAQLESILSSINGKPVEVNVINMDDPISMSPLNYKV